MASLPAYAEYVNRNVAWLGETPAHWNTVPLKHMATFENGCVFPPNSWAEEGIPIIRIENLNGGDNFNYFAGSVAAKHHVSKGDLLFGWSGNRGTSFGPFLWSRNGLYYLNQHIFKVTGCQCEMNWFYWCLRAVTAHVEEQASGIIGMVHVTKGDLGAIKVCVPPTTEQQAIARFLDFKTAQINALIAKKQTLLDKLAEKRTALISHAVTKGLDPSVPMKDSGVDWLGEIPAHWSTKRLRFLTTMTGGMTPNTGVPEYWNGDIPWITPKDMKREVIGESIDTLTDRAIAETGIRLHDSGRVLIVVRGMILAHTFPVAINAIETTVNQDMKVLSSTLNHEYLAFLLRGIQGLILSLIEESAHGTKVLRTDAFKNVSLPVPPIDEQDEIVQRVGTVTQRLDEQVRAIRSAIGRLQEYRSALITNAVTGKMDVRNVPIPDGVLAEA